jgi:hypothetical protein
MAEIIDIHSRRAVASNTVRFPHATDSLTHIANTANAMSALLRACKEQVAEGALDAARIQLVGAALAMLGPGWELRHTGKR